MRMRNKPYAEDYLLGCDFFVEDPAQFFGKWRDTFNKKQVKIELGCGKGDYVVAMAQLYPEIGWVAIERNTNVAYITAKKIKQQKLDNVRLINDDIKFIDEWFDHHEVDEIYLNFSDPWHKRRHHKRRLTSEKFLNDYQDILIKDGHVIMKTDNMALFEYSLASFSTFGFVIDEVWLDFRAEDQNDPITEYEQRFMDKGQPIYRAIYINKK